MKSLIKIIPVVILLASCGSGNDAIKKEIIKKKQKIAQIENQIIELESKLTDTAPVNERGALVKVEEVKTSQFKHYVEVQGKLDGEENVQVYPKGMGGSITKVNVNVGQNVKKGEVIATMDDEVLQKAYQQVKSQYELANQMFEKQKTLWDQKIGSEVQYLQAKTQKEGLESSLASIEKQLADTRITSPIDGTIEDLPLKVGQTVSAGFPVATVVNFSSIKIVAEVAEAYSNRVNKGDSVLVFFPDLNKEILAIVSNASKFINPVNRSFKIEVRLNSPSTLYKVNMLAVLKINDYKADNVVTIPVNLIQTDAVGNYVYVSESLPDKIIARKAYIEQGQSYKGMIEVLTGLKMGDKLISSGYLSITNGAKISY
jgi:membrane fusion protein (multidrug efflux system)